MNSDNNPAWNTPEYSSGFLMCMGFGFVVSMIAVQLPNEYISRTGGEFFALGVLASVVGYWRLKSISKKR